ncbi:MAG: hypothetical protein P8X70_00740 [Nanoarchaeota archaeon]
MRASKIIEFVLGIFVFIIGFIQFLNLIGLFVFFGFESAYVLTGGFKPLWMYSLGFIVGGVALILDRFNKKSKFGLGLLKNKKGKRKKK